MPSKAASRRITPRMPGARPRRRRRPGRRRRPPRGARPSRRGSARPSAWSAAGVLADVGQALGDREVDRGLDRRGRPAGQRRRSPRPAPPCRARAPGSRRRARGRRAPAGGCRAPPSAGRRWPRRSSARASLTSPGRLGVALEQLLGHAEAHRQRDQPGLGAVVQVALEPAQLGRGVVDGLGARLGQHLRPAARGPRCCRR